MIDFEGRFRKYLHDYALQNKLEDDELDEVAPELYLKWLDTPKEWLEGKSPVAWFESFDAAVLVSQLGEYIISGTTLPGPLMNRITDLKEETYPFLIALLTKYEGEKSLRIKQIIIRLIEEMDKPHPYNYYIGVISAAEEKDDFSESAAEELKNSGDNLIEELIIAFENAKSDYASDCFLDILCDLSSDKRVYQFALEKFLYSDKSRAFYASCLGKLGNADALSYLEEALREDDLGYYDYMAIKNAVEELGGEVAIDRDFSGDRDYESLKNLEE